MDKVSTELPKAKRQPSLASGVASASTMETHFVRKQRSEPDGFRHLKSEPPNAMISIE